MDRFHPVFTNPLAPRAPRTQGRNHAVTALALEGVRSGKLTEHQAREMLGIRSRYEMDGFLKVHGVPLPTTLEQIVADSETAIAFSK